MRRPGRRVTALGAVVVLLTFLPVAASGAVAAPTTQGLQGPNRYATAVAIAEAKFPNGVGAAVLTSGLTFPDALAGAFLAGQGPAAILLTDPNTVPPELTAGLAKLHVRNVAIVGGTAAVSDAVAQQLAATPSTASGAGNLQVARTAGSSRYDTMLQVDTVLGASAVGSVGGKRTAILASGANFPDALAAAPASYKAHLPIVLTAPDQLSPQAATVLSKLAIKQVIVMGGPGALSDPVISAVQALGVTILQRFSGTDRADTAQQFATYEVANLGFSNTEVTLARGDNFADALAGAQYAGDPKPILIVQKDGTLSGPTTQYLVTNGSGIKTVTGFGAVGSGTLSAASNAVQGHPTSGGGTGGGAGTGGLTITPNHFPNDYNDHAVVITGPLQDADSAWIMLPGPVNTATCAGQRYSMIVTANKAPTELDGTFNVDNSCMPGAYDLFVLLQHSDGSRQTLTCQACVTVTPARTITAVSPNSVGNDGTDGYVHNFAMTGTNLDPTSYAYVQYTGTPSPGTCEDQSTAGGTPDTITVQNLKPNGSNELDGTIQMPSDCPTGTYDVVAYDHDSALTALCHACLTITAYTHTVTIDSVTPTTFAKGATTSFVVTGHGMEYSDIYFVLTNTSHGVKIVQTSQASPNPAVEIDGSVSLSAGTGTVCPLGPCAPVGSYYVMARPTPPNIPTKAPGDADVFCCVTITAPNS